LEKKAHKTQNTITRKELLNQCLISIREQGFAVEEEETEIGAYSIAAPIRNHQGNVFASISLSGPIVRMKENREQIINDLKELAGKISGELGYYKLPEQYECKTSRNLSRASS
jgi:DNA-binding IclR family transcriptional regulator